jgi:hypothetical protein
MANSDVEDSSDTVYSATAAKGLEHHSEIVTL